MKERPVTHKEFIAVLKQLGFQPRRSPGSSHEQWVLTVGGRRYRVTVDSHHAPYHRKLLGLMLHQAGLSKKTFFKLLGEL